MARRSGLGRGLEALIPVSTTAGVVDGGIGHDGAPRFEEIAIGAIEANPHQPRRRFDEETLTELTASIREIGVLQPVLLRPVEPGRYQLIAGERRWRAAQRAGLATIPAIIRTTDDLSSVEQALVENLQRDDLSPLEEAGAYQELIDDFGLSHEQVAIRVGKSRAAISNTLRLLQLPAAVQHLLTNGRLSAGHARALLATPDRSRQEALAVRAVEEGLSVRALEDLVRAGMAPAADPAPVADPAASASDLVGAATPALRPPGLLELEELLSEYLHTRVRVSMGGNRGKMVIEYADLEDLERIYRRMTERGAV
jgi:ParB family transcriptional regulator, chromosome partitioning protein